MPFKRGAVCTLVLVMFALCTTEAFVQHTLLSGPSVPLQMRPVTSPASSRLPSGGCSRGAECRQHLTMRERGGGLGLSQAGAFLRSQALPVGLMLAILVGLAQPRLGCAVGQLGFIKYAPHCIFFVGGLLLKTEEAKQALRAVKAIVFGVFSILFLTSFVGVSAVKYLPLAVREFSVGAALFVCMPCTINSGAALSLKAGGNFALSLLLTTICSTAGIFTVPVLLDRLTDIGGGVHLPVKEMVVKLCETVLLPLAVGKLLTASSDAAKATVARNRGYLSLFTTACIVCTPWVQISKSAKNGVFTSVGLLDVTSILALLSFAHAAFLVVNFLGSKLLGLSQEMTKSVVFVASSKTLPLALMVLGVLPARVGDKGLIALPCILGHFAQILMDSALVSFWKGSKSD